MSEQNAEKSLTGGSAYPIMGLQPVKAFQETTCNAHLPCDETLSVYAGF